MVKIQYFILKDEKLIFYIIYKVSFIKTLFFHIFLSECKLPETLNMNKSRSK